MNIARSKPRVAAAAALTAIAVLGTATAALAAPAHPAKKPKPPKFLTIVYAASGSSLVAKPKSTVPLGPTTLTTTLNQKTLVFTGTLPLPPEPANFKVLGFIPVTATVTFIPAKALSGTLTQTGSVLTVSSTSSYVLQLSNVSLAGIPANVGSTCETSAPVEIDAATPSGQAFNVFTGGNLAATYTIGNFANCGLTTSLINLLVPGPNNTLSLALSDGQLQPPPA